MAIFIETDSQERLHNLASIVIIIEVQFGHMKRVKEEEFV